MGVFESKSCILFIKNIEANENRTTLSLWRHLIESVIKGKTRVACPNHFSKQNAMIRPCVLFDWPFSCRKLQCKRTTRLPPLLETLSRWELVLKVCDRSLECLAILWQILVSIEMRASSPSQFVRHCAHFFFWAAMTPCMLSLKIKARFWDPTLLRAILMAFFSALASPVLIISSIFLWNGGRPVTSVIT